MRYAIEPDAMLAKCQRLQWSVTDIDWEAPGANAIDRDRQLALAGFMADLYWIESIAAQVFAHMRDAASEPALAAIFGSFAVDEQRHADAELLLMRRWSIAGSREVPAPNPSARNLMRGIERAGHRVHPAVYSAIIPFTELVLDGALIKHLDATLSDPVSSEVFRRINADEARHLAVDFYLLERYGAARSRRDQLTGAARSVLHPVVLYSLLLGYLPMLERVRPNVLRTGLGEEQLVACVRRYVALGDHSPAAARHPVYRLFRFLSRWMVAGHHEVGELLLRVSDLCDALDLQLAPARRAAA